MRSVLAGRDIIDTGERAASQADAPSDRSSFDAFYRSELPRLVALAHALCGRAAADDVAQDAMIVAYRRWGEIGEFTSPEAWVRRVCANLATSLRRRRSAEARAVLRLSRRPSAPVEMDESETFWAEVRRLPRRQRQAVALRYIYDLSLVDIAKTLECSEGSVKVHLSRARSALSRGFGLEADES